MSRQPSTSIGSPNEASHHSISRKHFLSQIAKANMVFLVDFSGLVNALGGEYNAPAFVKEMAMKKHFAMARALSHEPPPQYRATFPNRAEYELRRTAAVNLLINKSYFANDFNWPINAFPEVVLDPDPEPLYKALTVEIPSVDILNSLDKDSLGVAGTILSGAGGVAGTLLPEVSVPMALVGAVGTGLSVKSALMDDKNSQRALGNATLQLAQAIWDDPKARHVLTKEVKTTLREAFGIDFDAPVEEQRKYLPDSVKTYVDLYLQNKGLSTEQLQRRETDIVSAITLQVNNSVDGAVKKVIDALKSQRQQLEQEQLDKSYRDGEIQGGIYLAGVFAENFISPRAAKIITAVANSAVQMSTMLAALSLGALGPVGLAAGCVLIALNLLGAFGESGPSTDQLILDAISKVQDAVAALRKEMRELFQIVIDNQQKMMERIDAQLELIKSNQVEATRKLLSIQEELKLSIDENRLRGRTDATATLNRKVLALNTQINKMLSGDTHNEGGKIEEVIEEAYLYATKTTKYGDFTGFPDPEIGIMEWDPAKFRTIYETIDRIDFFIGLIPVIFSRYAPTQVAAAPNNPRALGYAAMAISAAYFSFPENARVYETGRLHYLSEMGKLLSNTKAALFTAVNKATIEQFKRAFLEIVSDIMDQTLAGAERFVYESYGIQKGPDARILAAGPYAPITSKIESTQSMTFFNLADFLDHSTLESSLNADTTKEYHSFLEEIASPKVITFQGLTTNSDTGAVPVDEFMTKLESFGVIGRKRGPEQRRKIYYFYRIVNPIYYKADESFVATTITVHQSDGSKIELGDASTEGWVEGHLTNQRKEIYTSDPLPSATYPLPDRNVFYISGGIQLNPYTSGSSSSFLKKLTDLANQYFKLRSDIVSNTAKLINDPTNNLSAEFDAAIGAIKMLAGLNIYLRTGNTTFGTAVAKDRVIGINAYLEKTADGSAPVEQKEQSFFSSRMDLADWVSKITSKEYLYSNNYLFAHYPPDIEVKAYIKSELLAVVEKLFNNYISIYFAEDSNAYNLPEMTIATITLAAGEAAVHHLAPNR